MQESQLVAAHNKNMSLLAGWPNRDSYQERILTVTFLNFRIKAILMVNPDLEKLISCA
ncbi:MAG: hypothetical protein LAT51_01515 [Flavobacteriaceae bacterium]|nr:hypothetical protein [Flavobacteriaceae bacterium]